MKEYVEDKQREQKKYHDGSAYHRVFEVGQSVLVRNLREGPCWVIRVVSKRLGPVTYEVEVGGQVWKRHTDQLMAYKGSMGSEVGGATNMTEDPPVLPVVLTVAAGVVMPEVVRCLLLASPPW